MKNDIVELTTREDILNACARLFYEKGYCKTSFQDICREAHVYRGTIYYYFKDKSMLRREVLEAHFKDCTALAEKYCDNTFCIPFLAHYIQCCVFLHDAKIRRFIMEYFEDEPVYDPKKGLSQFYKETFHAAYLPLILPEEIPALSFASVYGYIAGIIRLTGSDPAAYSADRIFFECLTSIMRIWNLEKDRENVCSLLKPIVQNFPVSEIELHLQRFTDS